MAIWHEVDCDQFRIKPTNQGARHHEHENHIESYLLSGQSH